MIHIEYLKEWISQKKRERLKTIADNVNRSLSFRFLLSLLMMSLSLMSCSSDEEDEVAKRREFAQIVENRSAKDLLNDLYVGSDGNIQSLARMLNATPSSIERIRKGETEPTDKFDNRIKEVSIYYFQNEQSYSKLRSILDDEWGWYDTLWNLPNFYPYWFWGVTLVIFLLGCFLHGAILIGNVVELVLMGVAWYFIYFATPDDMDDKYIETINPTIERVI